MTKFYVFWRDLRGVKHRSVIYADNSYMAASLCRLKYDNVDIVFHVEEVRVKKCSLFK